MSKHHQFSPSSLGLRKDSPCFVNDPTPNPAALRGTKLHKAIETGDNKKLRLSEIHIVNKAKITTSELKQLVYKDANDSVREYKELRLPLQHDNDIITSGTLDYVVLNNTTQEAAMVDYKFGKVPVDIKGNIQQITYGCAVLQHFKKIDKLDCYIYQEKLKGPMTIMRDEVPKHVADIKHIIDVAIEYSEKGMRRASLPACKYCKLRNTCGTYKAFKDKQTILTDQLDAVKKELYD